MLRLQQRHQSNQFVKLAYSSVTLGRDENNDMVINASSVSDFHAEITCDAHQYYLVDLLSANGSFVNEQRVAGRCELKSWDILRLGSVELEVVDPNKHRPGDWALRPQATQLVSQFHTLKAKTIVGRDPDCDIVIDSNLLSRQHAQLILEGDHLTVVDLGSANGTFINDKRVESSMAQPTLVQAGDEIRFDQQAFIIVGPSGTPNQNEPIDDNHTIIRPLSNDSHLQGVDPVTLVPTASEPEAPVPQAQAFEAQEPAPPEAIHQDIPPLAAKPVLENSVEAETRYMPAGPENGETRYLGESPAQKFAPPRCLASLLEQSGLLDHQNISLAEDVYFLGRENENNIVLADSSVSKKHAKIAYVSECWKIEDLASRNGTLINGAAIDQTRLQSGDRIELGKAIFIFECDSASGADDAIDSLVTEMYQQVSADTEATLSLNAGKGHRKSPIPIWLYGVGVLVMATLSAFVLYLWRSGSFIT